MDRYLVVVHNQPNNGGEFQPSPRVYIVDTASSGSPSPTVIAETPSRSAAQRIVAALNTVSHADELAAVAS